jgi:transaldolase/glucose-6-phosphate isomerase
LTITEDLEQAKKVFPDLETVGIKMDTVTRELEEEGVKAFESAFLALLESIDEKKKSSISLLGPLSQPVARRLSQLDQDRMSSRLWGNDAGLWTSDPAGQAEIRERLGWLNSIEDARTRLGGYLSFASEIHRESIDRVLILGMGGSSLTAEVFSSMLAGAGIEAKLSLAILDSTDPQQVAQAAFDFPPTKSLIIVASKSGGTAEVSAAFDYFWSLSKEDGSRFIAITDPGTSLESLARERGFRRIFSSDPRVGGRFSAMTDFGLLPAALLGMDLNRLLDGAERMKKQCLAEVPAARNPGIALGAVIAESALAGRDKLTILSDSAIAPLAGWIEQIIAESSGKDGKGILPIPNEPLDAPDLYGKDRLFVYLRQTGELDNGIAALRHAEFPVIELPISGPYQLGHEFFRWEMAVSTACHILGVNAFDQPDVQESKNLTKLKISEYRKDGVLKDRDLIRIDDLRTEIRSFLEGIKRGGFAAVNAYLPRNFETTGQLQSLRVAVRERARCAVSVGFGPRFQHSTGQYHKGGPNTGSFLQLLYDPRPGEEIPGEGIDFGTLLRAQAVGDYAALISAGRRVLRVVLSDPSDLRKLIHLVWDADDSTTTTSAVG